MAERPRLAGRPVATVGPLILMRVVCLSAEAADMLFRLGCWDHVVGVSAFARVPGPRKPAVSGFATGDVARILRLRPDWVITFSDVQAELARELIRAGAQVLALNHDGLAGVAASLRILGRLLGVAAAGERLAADFLHALQRLRFEPVRRPRVYFEEWDDPLVAGIGWVRELVELAGGEPIASWRPDRRAEARVCTPGALLADDPELILLSWCGRPADCAAVRSRPGWDRCAAVRDGEVHEIDPSTILQASPALLEGLATIRKLVQAWCARH